MSELKVYHHELRHNEYEEFYLKYEADKVIEELKADYDEACDRLQTANLIKDEQLAETRHSKYKRCLAMAEMCNARYDEEDAKVNGCGASWEYISKEMKYWERWRWRWEALAEKFKDKEAK
jgi:hypothetical protein